MRVRKRYQISAIGATSVTLEPVPAAKGPEDENRAGDPAIFGTTSIVITQGVTPSTAFWKAARKYLVTFDVVDG